MSASILHAVNSSNVLKKLTVDSDGKLNVTGGSANTEVTHSGALGASPDDQKGMILAGFAGTPSVTGNDACLLACSTSGELKVSHGTLSVTGGGTESGALRVTLANDSTGTLTVDNGGTFAVQSTLQAGTANVGMIEVMGNTNAAGSGDNKHLLTDDAGHLQIDVLTAPETAVTHSTLSVTGGGTESGALRVTLASDSTGTLTVDNGGTFAVQSTLQAGTANVGMIEVMGNTHAAGSGDNKHLLTDAAGHLQVDVLDCALPSGAATAVNQTAVQSIHDSAISNLSTQSGTMLMGVAGDIAAVTSGDSCLLSCSTNGALKTSNMVYASTGTRSTSESVTASATYTSSEIDLSKKTSKLTIWGYISGITGASSGYNNIQILGSNTSSGTFDDMGSNFEILFDSDGKFGTTIDIHAPFIKLQIVNSNTTGRTLVYNLGYKQHL